MENALILLWWSVVCCLPSIAAALNCYMCLPVGAATVEDANIDCLALGWEISCSPQQDRCFSKTYLDNRHVEKGCTRSADCVGTTSCCQGQYCNGDPLTSQTGYGQPCNDLSNCIQGSEVMRCALETPGDVTKRCLCTDISYRRGSTCKRKSYPDETCTMTSHCYDVNTTCVSGTCLCPDGMYGNVSRCDPQVGIGNYCLVDNQCSGLNTQCAGEICACAYGYDVINGTDSCSGTQSFYIKPSHPSSVLILLTVLVVGAAR